MDRARAEVCRKWSSGRVGFRLSFRLYGEHRAHFASHHPLALLGFLFDHVCFVNFCLQRMGCFCDMLVSVADFSRFGATSGFQMGAQNPLRKNKLAWVYTDGLPPRVQPPFFQTPQTPTVPQIPLSGHRDHACRGKSDGHAKSGRNILRTPSTVQRLNFVTVVIGARRDSLQCGAKFGRGHQRRRHTGDLDMCRGLHTAMVCMEDTQG